MQSLGPAEKQMVRWNCTIRANITISESTQFHLAKIMRYKAQLQE